MVRRFTARNVVALIALAVACKGVVGESHKDPGNGSGDTRNWAFSMSVNPPNVLSVTQGSVD